MDRCAHCEMPLEPGASYCARCGRSQPLGILDAPTFPGSPGIGVKPCPKCRGMQPEAAAFCGDCGYSFSQPLRPASGGMSGALDASWGSDPMRTRPSSSGFTPVEPAWPQAGPAWAPGAPAGPQRGGVNVPGAPAAPQSGTMRVSGAPGVPHAPAWPQAGSPGVPGAPTGPQSGVLPGAGSRAAQATSKGLGRVVRQKLLGTLHARIMTAIVVLAVVGATGVTYTVVTHGQNSATSSQVGPSDTASFKVTIDVKTVDGLNHSKEYQETLIVQNGTVCQARDDGKRHLLTGGSFEVINGLGTPYQEYLVARCQGSYQTGKLTYTETVTYLENDFPAGIICNATTPLVLQQLTGTFTSATRISGNFYAAPSSYHCALGYSASFPKKTGTWSGGMT